MALTVEDGSGLATADALVSLAFCDTYHTDRGNTAWTGLDADKEGAIRRASFFLSNSYAWEGRRVKGRNQALAWPRAGVSDAEGLGILSTEVPTEVQQACAEAALRELVTVGALTPDYTPSERQSSVKAGPVSVTFDLSRKDADAVRPVMLIVRDLIGPFLAGGNSMLAGEAVRAG